MGRATHWKKRLILSHFVSFCLVRVAVRRLFETLCATGILPVHPLLRCEADAQHLQY